MAYSSLSQRRRFVASLTMSALVLTQLVTGVFPIPIAPTTQVAAQDEGYIDDFQPVTLEPGEEYIPVGDNYVEENAPAEDARTYNALAATAPQTVYISPCESADAQVKVDITAMIATRKETALPQVHLGNGQIVADNTYFPVLLNGSSLTDSRILTDVPGLSVQRGNGWIKFLIESKGTPGKKGFQGTINIQGSRFYGIANEHRPNKVERPFNGKARLGRIARDEIAIENDSTATFTLTVGPKTDSFTLYYENIDCDHQCNDGVDNDGDGKVDYPADQGCSYPKDDDERNPVITPCESRDAQLKVDFTGTIATRQETIIPQLHLGSTNIVSDNIFFPIKFNGSAVTDNTLPVNVPGMSAQRGDGWIKFLIESKGTPGKKGFTGKITIEGMRFYGIASATKPNKVERPFNGKARLGRIAQDEIAIENDSLATFTLTVGPSTDSFTLYYETIPCDRPECKDGIDNDNDGKIDYPADPGCSTPDDPTENPNPACSDNVDNDGDAKIDAQDPGCHTDGNPNNPNTYDPRDNDEFNQTTPQCKDGIDNDNDGKIDYPADPGCDNKDDNDESNATLTITKTGPATITAGNQITYDFIVKNTGNVVAKNVITSDFFIDANGNPLRTPPFTYVGSVNTLGCTNTNGNVACSFGDLQPGQTLNYSLIFNTPVKEKCGFCGQTVMNQADVAEKGKNSVAWGKAVTKVDCPTDQKPKLEISKTGPASVNPNGTISYTIVAKNTGNGSAKDTVVVDNFPTTLTYISGQSTPGCALEVAGRVKCVIGELGAGQVKTYNLTFSVSSTASCDSTIVNQANLQARDGYTASAAASTRTECIKNPNLTIDKTGPATINENGTATYTILIKNTGNGDAQNVVVTDYVPGQLKFTTAGSTAGCTEFGPITVNCAVGTLAAGQSKTLTLVFTVNKPVTTCDATVTNNASVSASNAPASVTDNATSTLKCEVKPPVLEITKTGPATVNAGGQITYNFVVKNTGAGVAKNVITSDFYIDANGNPLYTPPFTYLFTTGANCSYNNGNVACSFGDLQPGQVVNYSMTFQTPASQFCGQVVINQADVAEQGKNSVAWGKAMVKVECPTPNLSIDKTGPATIERGTQATYTITVKNSGTATANNVVVEDTYPTQLTYLALTSSSECVPTAAGTVRCALGQVLSGQTRTLTLRFVLAQESTCNTTIANNAKLLSDNGNVVTDVVNSTVSCNLKPNLVVEKVGPATVEPNGVITYTINAKNTGNGTAFDAIVLDDFPSTLSFLANQSSTSCALLGTGDVQCSLGQLAAGETRSYTLSFKVAQTAACNSAIVNNATVQARDGFTGIGSSTATVKCIDPKADLSIVKSSVGSIERGKVLLYTLTVSNAGPNTATSVVVTDTLASGLTFLAAQSSTECSVSGNTVTCKNFDLASGASKTVTIAVTVADTLACNSSVTNVASVNSSTIDPNTGNNQSNAVSTQVTCPVVDADLSIVKTGAATVQRGAAISYTLTVTNNGPATAQTITVTDPIPAGLTFVAAGSSPECTATNGTVTCTLASLAKNISKSFVLNFTVSSTATCGGSILNQATVSAQTQDFVQGNNVSQTVSTLVQCPQPTFSLSKTDNRTLVQPGETLTYYVTAQNTSTVDAANLTVTDTLPSQVTFVSASDGGTLNGNIITWNNVSLTGGAIKVLSIQVKVNDNTIDGTVLTNNAHMQGITAQDVTTVVKPAPQVGCIEITKQTLNSAGGIVVPVAQFTFRLDNANTTVNDTTGYAKFSNVTVGSHTISEVIPQGWQQVSITPANGTVNVVAGNSCAQVSIVNRQTTTPTPTFTISKTDGRTTVKPGETLTYTISVQNTSSVNASSVTITDALPAGVTFVSASNGGALTGNTVTWSNVSILAGTAVNMNVVVTVNSTTADGTTLLNTATVVDGPTTTDTTTVTVEQQLYGCIDIKKETYDTNNNVLTPVAQFTFKLDNNQSAVNDSAGNAKFTNVTVGTHTVSEIVPTSWTQLSVTPTNGVVTVSAGSTCATVVFKNKQTLVSGNPTYTISKTDNRSTADAGETLTYQITVTNTSAVNGTNVTVTDIVPSGTTYISSSNNAVRNNSVVTWSNLSIPANSSITLSMQVRVDSDVEDGDIIINTATVSGGPSATDTTTIETDNENEDLELTVTDFPDPLDICLDDEIEYDIRLSNDSDEDQEYDVVAFLDSDTIYVDSSDDGEDVTDERVEWEEVEVDEGETKTLRLTVRVDDRDLRDGDRVELRVHVDGVQDTEITRIEEFDCDRGHNNNGQIIMNIEKTADRTEAKPGSLVSYTVTIRNDSSREVHNVVLDDTFSSTQLIIEDAGTGIVSGGSIRWNLGTLAPNTTTVVRYRGRVSSSLGHGQVVPNTATVTGEGFSRSDTYQVLIVDRLPQTGIGGFGHNVDALNPASHSSDPALPFATWLTIIFSGLGMGGAFGRRLFF